MATEINQKLSPTIDNTFDTIKSFHGQKYTGMKVGGEHNWLYPDGVWHEKKVAPNEWAFDFTCTKGRKRAAPRGSGASVSTQYHWYIIADQKAVKLDTDTYETIMRGSKYKIGHKRPQWRGWSYEYAEQKPYKQQVIECLKETIRRLEEDA